MGQLWTYRFRRTEALFVLYVAILCGVGLARTGWLFSPVWCWSLLVPAIWALRRRSTGAMIVVTVFGLSLGWVRGSFYMQKLHAYEPLYYQKITLSVRADNDGTYDTHSQLVFDASNVRLENGQSLAGKIAVSGYGLNGVLQGDEIEVSGKLYPSRGVYQGRMSFAQMTLREHHASLAAEIRRRFAASVQSTLPEPAASLALGLLIGQRTTLPQNVKQDLLMVGLTHIIAVSGYNLTILLELSRGVLASSSKRLSTGLALLLIGGFLLVAGESASIVRAAIVSTLSIWSRYYGRRFKPLHLIALVAAGTAWTNPVYVWGDSSWYLSFLAFIGIMVLAPLLTVRLPGSRWSLLIPSLALETFCAEVMTLPFVLHEFGQMSLVGLPANLLIVTLLPLTMLMSFVAGIAGLLAGGLASWVAWPACLLLNYIIDTAHVVAGLSHVFAQGISFSTPQMLFVYGWIILVAMILHHRTNTSIYAKITEIND